MWDVGRGGRRLLVGILGHVTGESRSERPTLDGSDCDPSTFPRLVAFFIPVRDQEVAEVNGFREMVELKLYGLSLQRP